MQQTVLIYAVVRRENLVLLLTPKDRSSSLVLPNGPLQPGEDPYAALERIARERIKSSVVNPTLLEVVSDSDHKKVHTVGIVFSIELPAETAQESEDVWQDLTQAAESSLLDRVSKIILKKLLPPKRTPALISADAREVVVYTDGGSRGNPGPSAAGFVILDSKKELLFEGGKYLGITTNNQAEYKAVKLGLEKALELGARAVSFKLDSLLVVNQMTGIYKIKNRDLWPIHESIKELIKKFDRVSFTHVRREFNKEADALVNKVLDEHSEHK